MVQDGPGDFLTISKRNSKNENKYDKIICLHARLDQNCKESGPSHRLKWILRVRELSGRVPRGLYAIWEPFFGCVAQRSGRPVKKSLARNMDM